MRFESSGCFQISANSFEIFADEVSELDEIGLTYELEDDEVLKFKELRSAPKIGSIASIDEIWDEESVCLKGLKIVGNETLYLVIGDAIELVSSEDYDSIS